MKYLIGNSLNPKFNEIEEEYNRLVGTPYEVLFLFDVISHFNFKINEQYVGELIEKRADYKKLTDAERWNFWSSWALSENPGRAILFLKDSGWLELFPSLYATLGATQNPETHPEGSVFNHMVLSVNVAAEISHRENLDDEDSFVLIFSVLCHDLGKYLSGDDHEKIGVPIAESFLRSIGAPDNVIDKVKKLVEFHGADYKFQGYFVSESDIDENFVERLLGSIQPVSIQELIWVNEADINGRLDKQGNLLNLPYNQRVSEVYRKILSIYTKIQHNKFSDKNIINMFNQNFAYPDDIKPGYAQRNFSENMTKLIRDGYIKKSESEKTAGYYFSMVYREALRYCATLDYRSKRMLVDYMDENGVDLDTILLKGKTRLEEILNTSDN